MAKSSLRNRGNHRDPGRRAKESLIESKEKGVSFTEQEMKEVSTSEEGKAVKEEIIPVENSQRVKDLEDEIKSVKEKYHRILSEDRECRGTLSKYMYNITLSLNYANCKLKRVKPMRKQLESLYKRNLMLRAQIRGLKEEMGRSDSSVNARRLDILAQVALEAEKEHIVPEPLIQEEMVNTKKVIRRSRRKINIG